METDIIIRKLQCLQLIIWGKLFKYFCIFSTILPIAAEINTLIITELQNKQMPPSPDIPGQDIDRNHFPLIIFYSSLFIDEQSAQIMSQLRKETYLVQYYFIDCNEKGYFVGLKNTFSKNV